MSEITNRAAYLKGLADGLKLNTDTTEGKLISNIIDLLGDMAEQIEMLDDEQGFIVDKIDEMEDVIEIIGDETFGEDADEEDMYTIQCENCGAEIDFTNEDLDSLAAGEFTCPECGQLIELDFEDDCDCGCNHTHE